MVRIRLLINCLAGPGGIHFKGYEVDVSEEQAEPMVATHQWEYVQPPPKPPVQEQPEKETGEWTTDVPRPVRSKREFRRGNK